MTRTLFTRLPLAGILAAVGLSTAMSAAVATELDPEAIERGKTASVTCVACHQADGSGMNIPGGESWPRLSGLDRDYIIAQLQAFKEGTRESASMLPFANMLNDEQTVDVATYYASLTPTQAAAPEVSDEVMEHGKKLALVGDWDRYIVSCNACHGIDSQGNGSTFPELAGQHPGYIAQQITAWQNGTRTNDPQNLMKVIADRLDDRDIEAVSAWLASQPAVDQDQK